MLNKKRFIGLPKNNQKISTMYLNQFTIIPGEDEANSSIPPCEGPNLHKPKYSIVVMGPAGAGKTALVERFASDTVTPNSSPRERLKITSVPDFKVTNDADFCLVDLEIHVMRPEGKNWTKYRDGALESADGVLLVFNAADRNSFLALEKYKNAITQMRGTEYLGVTLAGNLMYVKEEEVEVKMSECVEWVKTWGSKWRMEVFQTNALDGNNVAKSFVSLIAEIRRKSLKRDIKEEVEYYKNKIDALFKEFDNKKGIGR